MTGAERTDTTGAPNGRNTMHGMPHPSNMGRRAILAGAGAAAALPAAFRTLAEAKTGPDAALARAIAALRAHATSVDSVHDDDAGVTAWNDREAELLGAVCAIPPRTLADLLAKADTALDRLLADPMSVDSHFIPADRALFRVASAELKAALAGGGVA